MLAGTLRLEVDEGDGYQAWTRVDDLLASAPGDRHFVLNRTTGEIRFGDGLNGHIPVANPNNPDANIVARVYRIGGGKRGNVPAQSIKTLVTPIDGIDENGVGNLQAAYGGRDEETLAEAKKRAPRAIKSRCRAVTAEDFEHLAMEAAQRSSAPKRCLCSIRIFRASRCRVSSPSSSCRMPMPPNPMPSEGTLRTVCAYLDQRRLLTTELYVIKPTYQQVEVQGEVIVNDNADLAEVNERIEKTLLDYFHPLKGGEDGLGWPFGGTIFYSRVYQRVFTVPGVQSIQRLVIVLDGEATGGMPGRARFAKTR